jgi:hypothetical protein
MIRSILFITLYALFIFSTFSQKQDTLSLKSLEKSAFQIFKISDFPKEARLKNTKGAYLAVLKAEEEYIVALLFAINDSLFVRSAKTKVKDDSYWCNEPFVRYTNDSIISECNMSKGIMMGQYFMISKGKLKFLKSFMYDLNETVYKNADKALKDNDPIAYCEAYMTAQYYADYKIRIKESLFMAHNLASIYNKNGDYKKAADLMYGLEQNCSGATSQDVADLFPDEFKRIWGDASLFYLKSNMTAECINLAKWFIDLYPKEAGIYLQYGDALYLQKMEAEYKKVYGLYMELMKAQHSETSIPSRVLDRMK